MSTWKQNSWKNQQAWLFLMFNDDKFMFIMMYYIESKSFLIRRKKLKITTDISIKLIICFLPILLRAFLNKTSNLVYRYIILVYPNVTGFLISNTVSVGGWKHCPFLKMVSWKWTVFVFCKTYLHQTFIKCVSN